MNARGVGLALGFLADRVFGDPRRWHPVAGLGQAAQRIEKYTYADRKCHGVAHFAVVAGSAILAAAVVERTARSPLARTTATAVATWAVLGGRSLEREAHVIHEQLEAGDLLAARLRLTHLVGRDTSQLGTSEIARAVVESVAENTSDAVVAPLLWGALGGVPGLIGYRAINTLDAMVGHRNARYTNFGWAAARADDLANLPTARLSGLLVLVARPRRAAAGWDAWRLDAAAHPSPNAGVVEAAFAGVLGVQLGGRNQYAQRIEDRATLGSGRAPLPSDIPAVTRLASRVDLLALLVAVTLSQLRRGRPSAAR